MQDPCARPWQQLSDRASDKLRPVCATLARALKVLLTKLQQQSLALINTQHTKVLESIGRQTHHSLERIVTMFKPLTLVLVSLFSINLVFAATCDEQALEKKLAGAAKSSFLKKCTADNPAAATPCETQAAEKKLAGAAKSSFLKKCMGDEKPASAMSNCESKAAEKKLAGAAKNSFLKKCSADAK